MKAILHNVDDLDSPYKALKQRLLEIYTPNPLDLVFKLLHALELGSRQPSQLIEMLLAMLPTGEVDGLILKGIFLSRIPADIRDHMATSATTSSSRQLAAAADALWIERNTQLHGAKVVAAAVEVTPPVRDDLMGAVAALNIQPKKKREFMRKRTGGGGHNKGEEQGSRRVFCRKHLKFGRKAYSWDDPANCHWPGNE